MNRMPTRDLLARTSIVAHEHETCCVIFAWEDEIVNHLLCNYIISQGVWNLFSDGWTYSFGLHWMSTLSISFSGRC